MSCNRGHGASRAAGPQCQHVRGVPWSSFMTGATSVSGALCFGMDKGVWCCWTVQVACLCRWGVSGRMVGGCRALNRRCGLHLLRVTVFGGFVLTWGGRGVGVRSGLRVEV